MENNQNTSVNEQTENQSTESENQNEQAQGAKTYTEEEVQKLIQAESDRRTNQALQKQKKQYEQKLSLASLDEQQRKEAEAQMTINELKEQLQQFTIEKNRSELKSVLANRNLDARFADLIVVNDNLEESQKNIELLDTLFKAAVKAEVEKRLAGTAPQGSGSKDSGVMTKEKWNKLSLAEQQKLYLSNTAYYKQFF